MLKANVVARFPAYEFVLPCDESSEICRHLVAGLIRKPADIWQTLEQPTWKLIGTLSGFNFSARPMTGVFGGRRCEVKGSIERITPTTSVIRARVYSPLSNWLIALLVPCVLMSSSFVANHETSWFWLAVASVGGLAVSVSSHLLEGASVRSTFERHLRPPPV